MKKPEVSKGFIKIQMDFAMKKNNSIDWLTNWF